MTSGALTRKPTPEPTVCLICQGVAYSIGVSNGQRGSPVHWTCTSCITPASRIARMNKNDIGLIESKAIDAVAKATLDDGIQTFIGALFDAGVDKLSDATPEQIDMAKERLIINGDAPVFVRDVVLAFGDQVKAAVERGDAPF